MSHTIHEESLESEHVKRAFIPSKTEALGLLGGSFLALLSLNMLKAVRVFGNVDYSQLTLYLQDKIEKLLAPTNNQRASTVLTMVLWMTIGVAMYIIVWTIARWLASYRRDVAETKGMVLPANFDKNADWHQSVFRIAVRLLSTIAFLYWLYLLLAWILPFASGLFLDSIKALSVDSIAAVIIAVVSLAGSIFVAMVFARCIVLRERVFES